jgi:hypothetical protein
MPKLQLIPLVWDCQCLKQVLLTGAILLTLEEKTKNILELCRLLLLFVVIVLNVF